MSLLIKIIIFVVFYTGMSFADIKKIKNNVYSSLEQLLGERFKNTDFSIKSIEETKPQISIKTLKPIVKNENDITFFKVHYLLTMVIEKH